MAQWVILMAVILPFASGVFEPGCSFMNQQCVYNVKLGHEGQCDVTGSAGTQTGSCCGEVQNNLNSLQAVVNELTKHMAEVRTAMNTSTTSTNGTLNPTLAIQLAAKEIELKSSQSSLATLIQQSQDVINGLKERLANVTQELNSCKGVHSFNPNKATGTTSDFMLQLCTFEDGNCGYKRYGSDKGTWVLATGTQLNTTGPREDHTLGAPTGTYMLMNPKLGSILHQQALTRKYTLESSPLSPAHGYCIRFWYNMNGPDVRELKAYIKVNGGLGSAVWQSHGQHGQVWHMAEIKLDSEYTNSAFTFVLEASTDGYRAKTNVYYHGTFSRHMDVDHNMNGDIAVDDIYIYNTTCSSVPLCPAGWVTRKSNGSRSSSCYGFYTTGETWYNSSVSCRREGMTSHLVSINSKEEQDFLVQTINSLLALKYAGNAEGFYTSGNDERQVNTFDWTDTGTPYQGTYSDWKTGQPNNVGGNQHCLLLQYADLDYQWGDVDCSEKHPYICEVELPVV